MASRKSSKAPEVLSAAYLERASNKNELLRRLQTLTQTLSTLSDDDELSDGPTPNLHSVSTALVSPSILQHRDPSIRLQAVLAACELFYIYAPEPPWEASEILEIFDQLIRQLGNLQASQASLEGSSGGNFEKYYRILEQLSEVKIGVVLVDLIRTERGTRRDSGWSQGGIALDQEEGGNDALETLCELLRTLLTCVSVDHPPEVAAHAELAISACIEEFEGSVPVQVLEELLTCVGQGPVVWVTNPAFAGTKKKKSPGSSGKKKGTDGSGRGEEGAAAAALPPPQIQQTNPSYLVAAKVLRRCEDKISSPIAALLNGLLTGDPNILGVTSLSTVDAEAAALMDPSPKSSGKKRRKNADGEEESPTLATHLAPKDKGNEGANVYAISYELHRIAPQILTTVIGTVSTSLMNTDLTKRWQATKLLGRLFGARSSDIASRFGPCFREWLRRSYDPESKIRETMVKCLVNFLTTQYSETDLCAEVNEALATIIMRDPTLDIRLLGIHQVCDLAHAAVVSGENGGEATSNGNVSSSSSKRSHPISIISADLLHAVGNRVSSKNKTEHKDAITGLAQIYHKHYMRRKLRYVQEGGDDVAIDEILEVWAELKSNEINADEEKFAWIPQRVFECVSFADATDAEMRSRVFQIVDDVLLGTAKKDSGSTLTPTSRAVGLALIVESVKQKENAYKWMGALFNQRSRLQKSLAAYLDARSKSKECESGSAEAHHYDTDAVEKLELVASLSAPLPESSSKSPSSSSSDLESILKKVHSAKDKHIFRILSTIASPSHSALARLRAFDELPKRTKGLGSAAQSWVKTLARRAAMGNFLNAESIEHCIILSQEAFEAENCAVSATFLDAVKFATGVFPALGSTKEGFKNLVEFFDASRTSDVGSAMKKEMEKYGVVTTLSEILARSGSASASASARTPSSSGKKKKGKKSSGGKDDDFDFDDEDEKKKESFKTLHEQLLRLCTRDGTPEQARNSVFTISSMIQPQSQSGGTSSASSLEIRVRKEKKEFEPLLKALVGPSRLCIPDDGAGVKGGGRIVSVLSAIAAIAECAPYAFNADREGHKLGWGKRALEFCLDTVLLGKNGRLDASTQDDGSSDEDEDDESSPKKRGSAKKKSKASVVTVHCKMLCGAIEVLVSHIRSTIVHSKQGDLKAPSSDHISQVFNTLTKIIEDGGVPPSSINNRYCKSTKDKAELRCAAAVNLLRLCDANLLLENTYLTPRNWHILSSVLLDEEKLVRSTVMEELVAMYSGAGKFRPHGSAPIAPSLRFLSLVSLCADGDERGSHCTANAGAANVGQRKSTSVKTAATNLTKMLRATCQHVAAQCRQQGRKAEKNFESRLKMKLMPEYSVPYALHLMAFRHETASAAGTLAGEKDSDEEESEDELEKGGSADDGEEEELVHSREASQKMLKKRLKWLFDPLIQSLGAGADNISFLLRMVELIGKHPPINVLKKSSSAEMSSLEMSLDDDDESNDVDEKYNVDEKEAAARMKIICQFAREVLLSHVKKDVNLTVYPGSIQIPGDLYARRTSVSPTPRYEESDEEEDGNGKKKGKRKPKKSISHYVKKREEEEEMDLDDDKSEEEDGSVEEDKSEDSAESDEKTADRQNLSGSTPGRKDGLDGTPNSGDTYEHSPTASPAASPQDELDPFGDVSPIKMAEDSPAAKEADDSPVATSAPKGRRKKRPSSSAAATAKVAKSRVSTASNKKKRNSNEIDVFVDSPMTDRDGSPPKRQRRTTPRAAKSGSAKQSSKATPISVPKSVMVNVTNAAATSSPLSPAVAPSPKAGQKKAGQKKSASKKKTSSKKKIDQKKESEEMDDLDFSDDSHHEPKKRAPGKKSSAKKLEPARKAKGSVKARISTGKAPAGKPAGKSKVTVNTKTKVTTGKAKAAAKSAVGTKKSSSRRSKSTPDAVASPSTTSEASSRPSSVRRGTRRTTRTTGA